MGILDTFRGNGKVITIEDARVLLRNDVLVETVGLDKIFNYFWNYQMNSGKGAMCTGDVDLLIYDEEHILQAADILIAFGEKRAKCNGIKLSDGIYDYWYRYSERLLLDLLGNLDEDDYQNNLRENYATVIQMILDKNPKLSEIVRQDDEHISRSSLQSIRATAMGIIKELKDYISDREKHDVRAFLYFLRDEGVQFNNEMDRNIYGILDAFGYIPSHVKRSHEHSSLADPFSNYISSFRKKKWEE